MNANEREKLRDHLRRVEEATADGRFGIHTEEEAIVVDLTRSVSALLEAEEESGACPPHRPWLYSVECNAYECQSCGNLFDKKEPYPAPEPEPEEGEPDAEISPEQMERLRQGGVEDSIRRRMLIRHDKTIRGLEERIEALEKRVDTLVQDMGLTGERGDFAYLLSQQSMLDHQRALVDDAIQKHLRTPEPDSEPEPVDEDAGWAERMAGYIEDDGPVTLNAGIVTTLRRIATRLRSRPSEEAQAVRVVTDERNGHVVAAFSTTEAAKEYLQGQDDSLYLRVWACLVDWDRAERTTDTGERLKERLIAAADKAVKKGRNKRNAVGMLLRATMDEIDRLCPPDSETTVSSTEAGERERLADWLDERATDAREGAARMDDQLAKDLAGDYAANYSRAADLLRTEPGGEAVAWTHAPPKDIGWYWYRGWEHKTEPSPVYVEEGPEGDLWIYDGAVAVDELSSDVEWARFTPPTARPTAPVEPDRLESVVEEFIEWAEETFPTATPATCASHLRAEVSELLDTPDDPEELADCAMLIFHAAHRAGVDLRAAMAVKLEKNRTREWGPPNEEGFREHVRGAPVEERE